MSKISFDYDGTLMSYDGEPIERVINMLKQFKKIGDNVYIITRRNQNELQEVKDFVKKYIGLDILVIGTNNAWKWKTLQEMNIDTHYDDDTNEIKLIKANTDIQTFFINDDTSPERQEKIKEVKYIDKKVMVVDSGLFVPLALRIAEDFGQVYYYNGYKHDYNKTHELAVGEGFDEIEWVLDFWKIVDNGDIDLFIYTGIGQGDEQEHLKSLGYNVFGSGLAEDLEMFRYDFVKFLESIGQATSPTIKVTGLTELKEELSNRVDNPIIKQDSNERGNNETYQFLDMESTEASILKPLQKNLGELSETTDFIIQDEIESTKEDGYDGFIIDGQYPELGVYGFEGKDSCYFCSTMKYSDLPEGVRKINDAIAPKLKELKMRGPISTEIKEGTDGESYFIDPTMRFGYPPTNCIMDNWLNMSECMYEGARGNMITPIFEKKYMCELIVSSDYAQRDDFKLIYPPEYIPYIKQPYSYKNDNGSIITIKQPQLEDLKNTGNTTICSVVYRDDDPDVCVAKCVEIVKSLKGYGLKYNIESLYDALADFKGTEKS